MKGPSHVSSVRQTLAASDVEASGILAPRHSEHVTLACFPENAVEPLHAKQDIGWNCGIDTSLRASVAVAAASGALAKKRLRSEPPRGGAAAASGEARTIDQLLAYLQS
jgi:hypothetical protein